MSATSRPQIYRARVIVPMSSPVLEGGWLRIRDGRIVELGRGNPGADHVDLGDVAILPRFVNAHTHLEFSDLAAPIGQAGMALPQWIAAVVAHRRQHQRSATAKLAAVRAGLAECAAAGTGAIGEIGTPPLNYDAFFPVTERRTPAAAAGTRQEDATIVLFAEVLGLTASAQQEAWSWARAQTSAAGRAGISVPIREVGISPHAPYSTPLALVERAAAWARQQGKPLAMHLAESPEELELLKTGTGPFREMLERMGLWDDRLFPVADGIDRYLELLERAPRVLVVHGNYLRPAHWERLAQRRGASVVYCPRTHAFFGHDPYPLAEMLRAGVRVVLGTDSRASNPDLSIWREARHAWRAHRVDPWRVLEMVTRSGAAALGLRDVGTLAVGVPARCNSVPIKPVPFGQLGEALLESDKVAPF